MNDFKTEVLLLAHAHDLGVYLENDAFVAA